MPNVMMALLHRCPCGVMRASRNSNSFQMSRPAREVLVLVFSGGTSVRLHRVLAGLLFFLLPLAACQSPESKPSAGGHETGVRGGRLVVAERSSPLTFNYPLAGDGTTINTSFFLMSARLVEFDHDKQEFGPGLAESWPTTEGQR